MTADDAVPLIAIGVSLLVLGGLWLLYRALRPQATTAAAIRIPDAYWWLWDQLAALEPSSELGGFAADKPGYHNARRNLPYWDYSVVDPPDWGGPDDTCAAFDWTFPNAQGGNYSTISLYMRRIIDSCKDPDDPRLDHWREFYGNADSDTYVEGYDTRCECDVTSDSSHLWHIHGSEDREMSEDFDNKRRLVSVLVGQPVDEWANPRRPGEDGTVLLNCPTDAERWDLFYIGPDGNVWHHWYRGGMAEIWNGRWKGAENLGGGLVVGTLDCTWVPDGSAINVCGLGDPDNTAVPPGCGQYWGQVVETGGGKSGWGSFDGIYGLYPDSAQPAGSR